MSNLQNVAAQLVLPKRSVKIVIAPALKIDSLLSPLERGNLNSRKA